jgi:hypothetical protein
MLYCSIVFCSVDLTFRLCSTSIDVRSSSLFHFKEEECECKQKLHVHGKGENRGNNKDLIMAKNIPF